MRPDGTLPRWAERLLLPLLNLAAALAVTAAIIALIGENPWTALKLLAAGAFGSQEGIGYTLYYATNFIFSGLAVAVAYQAGIFNIGVEGQAYFSGLGAGLVALHFDHSWPAWALLPACVAASALCGAAWALVPAWLQAKRGNHIVITTIMFNFIASALMTYLLVEVLIKPDQQSPETREFSSNAWMPPLHEMLAKAGISFSASPLNFAFVLALLTAGLLWLFIGRTRWGYELRVVGQNPSAAGYAGISTARIILLAMLVSGAMSGGVAMNEILGVQHRLLLDFPGGAGFVGIAVALMGKNHPVGIIAAAVLFGALYQGGAQLSFDMPHINRDMIAVIQGLVILACGAFESVFRRPVTAVFFKRK